MRRAYTIDAESNDYFVSLRVALPESRIILIDFVDKDFKIWYGDSDNNWIMFWGDDTVSLTNDEEDQVGYVNIDRKKDGAETVYVGVSAPFCDLSNYCMSLITGGTKS